MSQKRTMPLLLALCMCFQLSACNNTENTETPYTALQIAESIAASQDTPLDQNVLTLGEPAFFDYITNYYNLKAETLADGAILFEGGISADEIAVFELLDIADMDDVTQTLQQYLEDRTASFFGYQPGQVATLEKAQVATNGNHIALLVCNAPP